MPLERIALISDVHGNLTALEAVLADIAGRGIHRIINLGDNAGKGPRGAAVVERVREVCEVNIRGNWDDFLEGIGDDDAEEMRWWRDELSPPQRAWLRALPLSHDLTLSGRRVRLFHASAESPHVRVHFHHTEAQFDDMFRATAMTGDGPEPTVVGYADIHDAYIESRDGRTLFNIGSVGNPLDEPTPSYVILEGVPDADGPAPFEVRFVRVPYDVEAEIAVAEGLGMPQAGVWAVELRTAVYRGRQTS
ncbi:metallophosphoesterase family protein [Microbacterium sp. NEAU-LLC]|uniref:Metallophosphoesterase family protein n=1 Tax=Microbacterium helvum TaxID=2773713 RepID=A0ABR8NRY0_9MICO|nr:metallophosphoesterase family protein [Microbacterium helvum]MBD3943398.1 metallophosphoesterase family protein [Microbacterium helvum]